MTVLTGKRLPTPSTEDALRALEAARVKAAVSLELLVEQLSLRGFDPSTSTKNMLDIAEHLYKVSGMASKQQAQAATPVKVTFNFNAAPGKGHPEVVIEQEPEVETALGEPPEAVRLLIPVSDDLVCDAEPAE